MLTSVVQYDSLIGISVYNFKRQFHALVHVAEGSVLASSLELLEWHHIGASTVFRDVILL